MGLRVAGDRGRRRRRRRAGPTRPHPPGAAARLPGRAVPLPERAVALLRALAAARLPGARPAGGRRPRARRRAVRGARAGLAGPRSAPPAPSCSISRSRPTPGRWRSWAPRHARDRAPVARVDAAPRAAGGRRARVPDRWFWPTAGPPQAVGRPAPARQPARPGHAGGARPVHGGRCARSSSTATAPRLLHRGHDRPHPGRVEADRRPAALAYYRRLERESDLVFAVSPYRADASPQPFSFDLSYSYYSPAYSGPARGADLPAARLPPGRGCGAVRRRERRARLPRTPRAPAGAVARRDPRARARPAALEPRHGLPFAYNADEAEHFVPRAIAMLHGSLDPGYYENPPAFTYLLLGVFHVRGGDLARTLRDRPRAGVPHGPRRRRACWGRSAWG